MKYTVDFVKYFSDKEKELILTYIQDNINELSLHDGYNCGVDISDAI